MFRPAKIAILIGVAGGCAGPDHVTKFDEIVDTWLKDANAPASSAAMVHFKLDGSFNMTLSDGTPAVGTFEVKDPMLLLYPDNPTGTDWCIPRAVVTDVTLTFNEFLPDVCAKAATQPATMAPLVGKYNLKPPTM